MGWEISIRYKHKDSGTQGVQKALPFPSLPSLLLCYSTCSAITQHLTPHHLPAPCPLPCLFTSVPLSVFSLPSLFSRNLDIEMTIMYECTECTSEKKNATAASLAHARQKNGWCIQTRTNLTHETSTVHYYNLFFYHCAYGYKWVDCVCVDTVLNHKNMAISFIKLMVNIIIIYLRLALSLSSC